MIWDRYTIVEVAGREITTDDLDIYFDVKGSNNSEPNNAIITIYNLSDETRELIRKDEPIVLKSGYRDDYGPIFMGKVKEIDEEKDGADIATNIICLDDMEAFLNTRINETYPKGMKLVDVARDMIERTAVSVGKIEDSSKTLSRPITYTRDMTLHRNLGEIANELNFNFHVRHGLVYLIGKESGIQEGYLLTSDTGLISIAKITKEDAEADYKVQAFLIHKIAQDSIIEIDSVKAKGLYRVVKFNFRSNELDHMVEMEVKAV
jgi:hypothetical protein